MSLDLGWVLVCAGITGLVLFIYSLGVETGRSRGRKADMLHQRDRAMQALLRIVPSENDPLRTKPYDHESDGL